jgi:tannase/feruloyl esterase
MLGILSSALLAATVGAMPCESLRSVQLAQTTITTAGVVEAGPFVAPTPPAGPQGAAPAQPASPPEPIPRHCRLTMVLKPTSDSNINVELWMPTDNWNGKLLVVGNGGFAGSIQGYGDMQIALRLGYATAATDTGHSSVDGPNGMFALGHPEKIVDFAYRAVHELTVKSKQLIGEFYARAPQYSYFKGCSTGGRQAVMAAQRYPDDYDGIIAGALANRHIHMHTAGFARTVNLARNPDQALSEAKAKMVSDAVMKKCDTLHEGFLNNPRQCSFDFSTLLCQDAESDTCLTRAQLKSVETFYGGLKNSKGELIFSGQGLGNPVPALRSAPPAQVTDTVRIWAFQNANYDWNTFDLDRDMPIIDKKIGFVDAVDPDLKAFKAHGGKLLLYAGWGDTGITPENTVLYYESILNKMGKAQDDWTRLFMVPGMGHCRGGDGPHAFDTIGTLEQWRERGVAPAQIMARNPQSGLSRPLCPYPRYAKYTGTGDLKNAANWTCSGPTPPPGSPKTTTETAKRATR